MKKLFLFYVFVIVYFTLYPWTFVPFDKHSTILEGLRPLVGLRGHVEIVANLCLYLPLGALGVLGRWRGLHKGGHWIAVVAIGATLSVALETIQAWVPGRDSSLQDALTNTTGTIVGTWLGITIARYLPSGLSQGLPSPHRPMPVVLVAAWLVSQWFPFLPILRISQFSESLHALMQVSSLGWIVLADAFVAALIIGRLLREALTSSAYHFALAAACLVLPARVFIVVGAAPWPVCLAFAGGLLASYLVLARARAETRLLAAAAILLIAMRELEPFHFVGTAEPFYWIPFSSVFHFTESSPIRVISGKFFLYGATVWFVRESGVSLRIAAGGVGGLLIAGEWAQRYLPGRLAESTDPTLAVIAACVTAWLKDRPPAPACLPARPFNDSQRRHRVGANK